MQDRYRAVIEEPETQAPSPLRDVTLRSPPNWTAILFLAALGAVHVSIAAPAFLAGRWEGYLSLALGCVFLIAAGVCRVVRYEIAVLPAQSRISVRTGCRWLVVERSIPFYRIRGVRVTLAGQNGSSESRVELLCGDDDIECPPTAVPRQEALYLAIAMNVPLIKVMDDEASESMNRTILPSRDRLDS